MVKENIYSRKKFCRIDPRLAVNRKKEEPLEGITCAKTFSSTNERAQHHEQVKMSDRKK